MSDRSIKSSDTKKLLEALGMGRKNATLSPRLRELTGIPEATQRAILHDVDGSEVTVRGRRFTVVIGSGSEGYWICADYEEANGTTDHMRSRRRELDERIRRREIAIDRAFPEGPLQKALF